MITTSEIAPAPVLAPFVRCYTFREFDTNGLNLMKPWHASHEITMPFFLKAKPVGLNNPHTGQILKGSSNSCLVGLGRQYNGEMTFNGIYSFFEIVFKPNGFNKIFKIPANEITDYIINADDIFDARLTWFYEQLGAATGLAEMAGLADGFLMGYLKKQKFINTKDGITSLSNLIFKKATLISIDELAFKANMSKRNFQRNFIEQVGISPKLFCCINRFNHAFSLRLTDASRDWTSIAFECGYFDQAHLVKDFKKFAGSSPNLFLHQTPLTQEVFTNKVDI